MEWSLCHISLLKNNLSSEASRWHQIFSNYINERGSLSHLIWEVGLRLFHMTRNNMPCECVLKAIIVANYTGSEIPQGWRPKKNLKADSKNLRGKDISRTFVWITRPHHYFVIPCPKCLFGKSNYKVKSNILLYKDGNNVKKCITF